MGICLSRALDRILKRLDKLELQQKVYSVRLELGDMRSDMLITCSDDDEYERVRESVEKHLEEVPFDESVKPRLRYLSGPKKEMDRIALDVLLRGYFDGKCIEIMRVDSSAGRLISGVQNGLLETGNWAEILYRYGGNRITMNKHRAAFEHEFDGYTVWYLGGEEEIDATELIERRVGRKVDWDALLDNDEFIEYLDTGVWPLAPHTPAEVDTSIISTLGRGELPRRSNVPPEPTTIKLNTYRHIYNGTHN